MRPACVRQNRVAEQRSLHVARILRPSGRAREQLLRPRSEAPTITLPLARDVNCDGAV